jgi:hypothetical protein
MYPQHPKPAVLENESTALPLQLVWVNARGTDPVQPDAAPLSRVR